MVESMVITNSTTNSLVITNNKTKNHSPKVITNTIVYKYKYKTNSKLLSKSNF